MMEGTVVVDPGRGAGGRGGAGIKVNGSSQVVQLRGRETVGKIS